MPDVGRLQVRQHGKQSPRTADRVCQCEPVGKMELSNHGERLMHSMYPCMVLSSLSLADYFPPLDSLMDTDSGKRRPRAAFITPHGVSLDSYSHSGFKKVLIFGIDLQDNKGGHTS